MAVGLVAVVYYELSQVRSDVASAHDELAGSFDNPAILRTPEGRATSRATVDRAIENLESARRRAAGSMPLSLLRLVPTGSAQRLGLIALIDDATTGAGALRDLLANVDSLADRTQFADGRLPSEGLVELSGRVRATADSIRGAARSSSGLWQPLAEARDRFDKVALRSSDRLVRGADAIDAATSFMGGAGDRRYLVGLMNNAEMRDQGMVLSYVVLKIAGGQMSFERSGSVVDLRLDEPAATPIPPGSADVFGPLKPTQLWQSVNATADFAWSGRAMSDMYRQKTGQSVDGVIGVDVPGVAALLRSVGPVAIDGIAEPIDAENVGRIVLHDLYEGLAPGSNQSGRRELLAEVTRAVIDKVTRGSHDAVSLGRELGDAASGGHLRLWSSFSEEERVFEQSGLGGGPAVIEADRTFHVAVENRTATKLDYYVRPSVRQEIELDDDGAAVVRTTVVVNNQAPENAPPSYQVGPDEYTEKPGDYRAWILMWGPAGARQDAAIPESALMLSHHVVPVGAGKSVEMSFETVIPGAVRNGRLQLRLVPQPRLDPMPLEVQLKAPGWDIDGPTTRRGLWDRVWTLDWGVEQ
ncbi:MAG TPA: DUF4012 domain-containing protein [Acidimicrobiales bacterium]|nr:DUF4012 domain-containing protein [Acidimicrobiales bacterium]